MIKNISDLSKRFSILGKGYFAMSKITIDKAELKIDL